MSLVFIVAVAFILNPIFGSQQTRPIPTSIKQAVTHADRYVPLPNETVLEIQFSGQGHGVVDVLLHTATAPKTCQHIEALTSRGFYNEQRIFKVIDSPKPFLVQFGDPSTKVGSIGKPTSIPRSSIQMSYEDSGFAQETGAVALATLAGDPNSGDCQIYILLGNYQGLLAKSATVFGKVVFGMDVVQKLRIGDVIDSARIIEPKP